MPIYEYKCDNDHVFDVIQRMSEEPLTECQECGAPAARVLYSPAVHFKGSGFYNTDYGKKKKGNGVPAADGASESKSSEAGSSEPKSSEPKSDSKATSSASSD